MLSYTFRVILVHAKVRDTLIALGHGGSIQASVYLKSLSKQFPRSPRVPGRVPGPGCCLMNKTAMVLTLTGLVVP